MVRSEVKYRFVIDTATLADTHPARPVG